MISQVYRNKRFIIDMILYSIVEVDGEVSKRLLALHTMLEFKSSLTKLAW